MYIDIHRLKQQGFSKTTIAKMLGISRPTVIKYLNMNAEEFEKERLAQRQRTEKPDVYLFRGVALLCTWKDYFSDTIVPCALLSSITNHNK